MQVKLKALSLLTHLKTTTHDAYFYVKHGLQFIKERLKEPSTYVALSTSSAGAYEYRDDPFTHTVILLVGVGVAMVPNKKNHDVPSETVESGDTPVG